MIFIYVLLCFTCVILIGLVLMQDSKSGLGGLGGNTTMSAFGANTDKALIKATGYTAAAFLLLVLITLIYNKAETKPSTLLPISESKATTTEEKANTTKDANAEKKEVAPAANANKAPEPVNKNETKEPVTPEAK